MGQIEQTELVGSVWHFLCDLLHKRWTAHVVLFLSISLTFIITVSCYTLTFILHINVFSPQCRFKSCLIYQSKRTKKGFCFAVKVCKMQNASMKSFYATVVPLHIGNLCLLDILSVNNLTDSVVIWNVTTLPSCHLLHCSIRLRRALRTKQKINLLSSCNSKTSKVRNYYWSSNLPSTLLQENSRNQAVKT